MIRRYAAALLLCCGFSSPAFPDLSSVNVRVKPITLPKEIVSSSADRLKPLGASVLQSSHPNFGAFSGLRLTCAGTLMAITDTGLWFSGETRRDENGVLTAIENARFQEIMGEDGKPLESKRLSDFESLTLDENHVYLGAEHKTRVLRIPRQGGRLASKSRVIAVAKHEPGVRENNGFEAIATLPDGNLIALRERMRNRLEPPPGFLISTSQEKVLAEFRMARNDDYSITDADVAGDNLLVLERRVSPIFGGRIRIRSIPISDLKSGSVLEGRIIHQSAHADPMDNMEGLSVCETAEGYRLSLISDNNHWPLQRTLFLEFMLPRP